MAKREEVVGKKIGLITILGESEKLEGSKDRRVLGLCECGTEKSFFLNTLKRSKKANCGCYKREEFIKRQTKHGLGGTRIYKIWSNMKSRCCNEKDNKYSLYGQKGITIFEDWLNDVTIFHDWAISNGYKDDLTIDRIDSSGNYEPSNCRWVDIKTQNGNRSCCWKIEIDGVEKLAIEWARENKICENLIFQRRKSGWSDIDCVTKPIDLRFSRKKKTT